MFLNCKTYFSFRYGTYSAEELVAHAVELGHASLALTNINGTYDMLDFIDLCQKSGVTPIAGTEIRDTHGVFQYVMLAKNNEGFAEINHFLSTYLELKLPFPERPEPSANIFVIYPLHGHLAENLQENELIGILPIEANKLFSRKPELHPEKYVIRHPVTFEQGDYNLHRLLRTIDQNTILSKLKKEDFCADYERFVHVTRLEKAFGLYPAVAENTRKVMAACSVTMDFHTDKNKKLLHGTAEEGRLALEMLAMEGMKYRYGEDNAEAERRVRKELKVINDLDFNTYYLIAHDVTSTAEKRKFFHVGRGSGANSIVAYCLKITDVEPIKLDLYFERFLNKYRTSAPDFDLDFSHRDRDEIIRYVFEKYGKEYVALLGMYTTFQHNAVVRELGKVFGLPKPEIDNLLDNRDAKYNEDSVQKLILKYGKRLISFPNHLSIHPGGMLISEKPIRDYCALEMPPKGFATSQLDMFRAEKVGLNKLDILSQRGLGHIKEAIELVFSNKGIVIDIHDVERFMNDPKVAEQIRKADTIGCFYIESPAMRQLLVKLRCDNYITLVAASSIIRPGVSQSGMMKQYIQRFHAPNTIQYLHPVMEEHLKETYGVMVYQEDVIKIAHYYAGLDMAEADILRRAMSGKYRGNKEMERIKMKFHEGAKALNRPANTTEEVWRQIQSFGGYSFSKAHSASFAVESYQSLYLKTYFPMEFMVAVINNEGGFYSTELYVHELKRTGANVHLPCVNQSDEFTNISGKEVYLGLRRIQGLQIKLKERILAERNNNGRYADLTDFIERTQIGIKQLNTLINIGALRFTGKSKAELLWLANFIQKKSKEIHTVKSLFDVAPVSYEMPKLSQHPMDDSMDELELLGFPMCNPFDLVKKSEYDMPAANLHKHVNKMITIFGYYVTTKPVRTIKGDNMFFGTFIDANGDWLDSVHFPKSAKKYPLNGRGFYRMTGMVIEEFGAFALNVYHLEKVGIKSQDHYDEVIKKPAPLQLIKEDPGALEELSNLLSQQDWIKPEVENNFDELRAIA
jgi:DNA-directed DNA polymerase III PolC